MRKAFTVFVLTAALLSPGCALFADATDLLVYKAHQCVDDFWERRRNRHWAEEAWNEECCQMRVTAHTSMDDYAEGFKAGFTHYVYQGGSGEPPLVPPPHYRGLEYQTPLGYATVQDWFNGYRHGGAVAREGGYRQYVIGPTSLRPEDSDADPLSAAGPAGPRPVPHEAKTDTESLPQPRLVAPADQEQVAAPACPRGMPPANPGPDDVQWLPPIILWRQPGSDNP
jgi:hypothetical protein